MRLLTDFIRRNRGNAYIEIGLKLSMQLLHKTLLSRAAFALHRQFPERPRLLQGTIHSEFRAFGAWIQASGIPSAKQLQSSDAIRPLPMRISFNMSKSAIEPGSLGYGIAAKYTPRWPVKEVVI